MQSLMRIATGSETPSASRHGWAAVETRVSVRASSRSSSLAITRMSELGSRSWRIRLSWRLSRKDRSRQETHCQGSLTATSFVKLRGKCGWIRCTAGLDQSRQYQHSRYGRSCWTIYTVTYTKEDRPAVFNINQTEWPDSQAAHLRMSGCAWPHRPGVLTKSLRESHSTTSFPPLVNTTATDILTAYINADQGPFVLDHSGVVLQLGVLT